MAAHDRTRPPLTAPVVERVPTQPQPWSVTVPAEADAETAAPAPRRLPSHAARGVTTALRGADGRLAVVCV
jgi:hypothetical protein